MVSVTVNMPKSGKIIQSTNCTTAAYPNILKSGNCSTTGSFKRQRLVYGKDCLFPGKKLLPNLVLITVIQPKSEIMLVFCRIKIYGRIRDIKCSSLEQQHISVSQQKCPIGSGIIFDHIFFIHTCIITLFVVTTLQNLLDQRRMASDLHHTIFEIPEYQTNNGSEFIQTSQCVTWAK